MMTGLSLLAVPTADSMTDALIDLDGHAQTNGSELRDCPLLITKVSRQRAGKKVAKRLMRF
ncbi:hypothetical protein BTN82_08735 [Pseudomonas chlororaphis]|uniref:Uncharacterized protein n=1 Tax=Pseudomonas chlororaphis TaxID=587753 RepID=A0A1Q8ETF4_9PSED|nr:hypothetical protein BTN82_08735 [Pseudomonas chlororaphis]